MPPAESKGTNPLTQLFAELERFVNQSDYERAIKICDKILAQAPKDHDALHCKVISLIRLEKYTEALKLLSSSFGEEELVFEHAYSLYRTNQLEKALGLIKKTKQTGSGDIKALRHLEAQIKYRLEDFTACLELYHNLLLDINKSSPEYNDVLTNFNAVKAALLLSGAQLDSKYDLTDNTATYELIYNTACALIALGDLAKAEKLLQSARDLCRKSLSEDGYSIEDIEQELATIVVQLAYVYQLQGRTTDAKDQYQSVLKTKAGDATVRAVASNNLVSILKGQDQFDSAKKLRVATAKDLELKLFRHQKRVIAMNEALLGLYMHKYAQCKDSARKLLQKYPENDILYLILTGATYHQKKSSKALEELQEFAKHKPTSLPIHLAIIQLQLLQASNYAIALETLQSYLKSVDSETERYRPGVVALQVWLLEQMGASDKAMEVLDIGTKIWKKPTPGRGTAPRTLLKQAAAFKVKAGRAREAATDYEQLVKADPTDIEAVAGLITAYSDVDPSLAEKYGSSLPDVRRITMLVEELEKNVPGVKRGYVKKEKGDGAAAVKKKPIKKKRKPHFPKNYDPAATPDPERWLPKHLRSSYKVKGKGKKGLMKGSQGAAVAGEGGIGGTGSANIGGKTKGKGKEKEVVAEKDGEDVEVDVNEERKEVKKTSGGGGSNKTKKKKGKGNKW